MTEQQTEMKKSTWGKTIRQLFAGLVLAPTLLAVLALTYVEWFVDPFPNSLWILRILNTKYLVHVRADLTVDGEPLVMERTFRCFDPVDYKFLASRDEDKPGLRSNGQTGDTLAITTARGRLFAINAPDACGVLISRVRPNGMGYGGLDPAVDEVTPLHLSKGEIETPVLYEIHGGRHATQVDAYIARNQLRQGYHGVQLNELVVEKASDLLLKDWNGYEWFSKNQWIRHRGVNKFGRYDARYAFALYENKWGDVAREILLFNPQDNRPDMLDSYRAMTADAPIEGNNPFEQFLAIGYQTRTFGNGYTQSELRLPRLDVQNNRQRYQWFLESMFPCTPTDQIHRAYTCNPSLNGVISFFPSVYTNLIPWVERVSIGDIQFDAPHAVGYFIVTSPLHAYGFEDDGASLQGDW